MAKVVYMLGAGASCNALPTVPEMTDFLYTFARNYGRSSELEKMMLNMITESSLYSSPDVFARTLFLRGDPRFKHFNNMLSLAFFWKQRTPNLHGRFNENTEVSWKFKYAIDPRYFSLFSTIVPSPEDLTITEDLGFILWNYDSQIEESLKALKIPRLPKIVRLNGVAEVKDGEKKLDAISDYVDFQDKLLSLESGIKYGWDDQSANQIELESMLDDTERLVVIGYSFPAYNRFTDTQIISLLRRKFKTKSKMSIDLVGREDKSIQKVEESLNKIVHIFNWRDASGADKTPKVERVASPTQFPIPYELPIFGRA